MTDKRQGIEMKNVILLATAAAALALAGCAKSPAELCAAPDTIDGIKGALLDGATKDWEQPGENLDLKPTTAGQEIKVTLITLSGYDKLTKKVDCTASMTLEAAPEARAAALKLISPESGARMVDFLNGRPVTFSYSRQPAADGKGAVHTVHDADGLSGSVYAIARASKALAAEAAEKVALKQAQEFIFDNDAEFDAHKVAVFTGQLKLPVITDDDFNSAAQTQVEATDQIKAEGINFAGNLQVRSFGCGTGCKSESLYNLQTGAKLSGLNLPFEGLVDDGREEGRANQYSYRPNSTLMKAITKNGDQCVLQSFVWNGKAFLPASRAIKVKDTLNDTGICLDFRFGGV